MNRKQGLRPNDVPGRGWRINSTFGLASALAATIVVLLGAFFLTVMPALPDHPHLRLLGAQELVSTTIFAVAGVMAMRKWLDQPKALNVVLVFAGCFLTTNGGGTVRDLLLLKAPFWMTSLACLCIPVVVTALAFMVRPNDAPVVSTAVRLVDNFSTGVFVYVGVFKVVDALDPGHSMFLLTAMLTGVMTSMAGGMVRDFLLLRRIPTAFVSMSFLNGLLCSGLLAVAAKFDVADQLGMGSLVGWAWLLTGAFMLIVNEATRGRTFSYEL